MAKRTRGAAPKAASAGIGYAKGDTRSMNVDSMQNLVSGMGTEKDKRFSTFFGLGLMDRAQLDAAYRGDWISRKAVDIPAYDATREWREWQADPDDVTELETHEKDLNIQQKVMSALIKGRLYGGSALILGIDDGLQPDQPVELERLDFDCLSFVHVVTRFELQQGPLIWDILSPFYGEPEYYMQAGSGANGVKLHPSRVVKFIGNEIPDQNMADGWGDSILQAVSDAIIGAGTVSSSMAQLVAEAKLDVIKIPGLSENIINADYETRLKKRFGFANTVKSVFSMLLLDKEEEWERINSQFAGMPEVLKTFLLMACGAVDVPATRFLGQSPAGLSATGDSDTRNYYDRVTTEQKVIIQPKLNKLDAVLKRSALGQIPADGSDDDVFYIWRPLWSMTEAEKAEVASKKATVAKTDSDMGLINTVVLKKAREAQLIADGTYPGLLQLIEEFDDDPEMEEANAESAALEAQFSGAPPITDPNDPAYDPTKDPAAPEFNNVQQALPAPTKQPAKAKVKKAKTNVAIDAIVRRMQDASTPRTLYVRRDLTAPSVKALKAWAKKEGFATSLDDMHVTICYSKEPVDWLSMGSDWGSGDQPNLTVKAGGPRVMEKFGKAIVLAFANSDLSWRHRSMVERGASYDYDDYTPHVTITYDGGDKDIFNMVPYQGELVFGPEVFEQIKVDFNNETDTKES